MRVNEYKEGDKELAFDFLDATNLKNPSDPHMHKVLAWYDNEWGYSNRILDLIAYVARVKQESLTAR